MNVYEAVTKRRVIRRFKDKPVPYDVLERCVNGARLASSGGNSQICEYIIVDDQQLLPRMLDAVGGWAGQPKPEGGWSPEGRPKAYIVILINVALEAEFGRNRKITCYDVGPAAENMMLVAFEEGVGSCWLGSCVEAELKKILNIPDKYEVASVLALGYPDESPVLDPATDTMKTWVDNEGVRHVPKRELKDIMHRNRLP